MRVTDDNKGVKYHHPNPTVFQFKVDSSLVAGSLKDQIVFLVYCSFHSKSTGNSMKLGNRNEMTNRIISEIFHNIYAFLQAGEERFNISTLLNSFQFEINPVSTLYTAPEMNEISSSGINRDAFKVPYPRGHLLNTSRRKIAISISTPSSFLRCWRKPFVFGVCEPQSVHGARPQLRGYPSPLLRIPAEGSCPSVTRPPAFRKIWHLQELRT